MIFPLFFYRCGLIPEVVPTSVWQRDMSLSESDRGLTRIYSEYAFFLLLISVRVVQLHCILCCSCVVQLHSSCCILCPYRLPLCLRLLQYNTLLFSPLFHRYARFEFGSFFLELDLK